MNNRQNCLTNILLGLTMLASSQTVLSNGLVTMRSNIVKSKGTHDRHSKMPNALVTLYIMNNELNFGDNCVGGTLQVLSGESVIYSTEIDESCVVELPESISGVVELRLTIGYIIFSAETEI